jgi:hypothetical protein
VHNSDYARRHLHDTNALCEHDNARMSLENELALGHRDIVRITCIESPG